MSELLEAGAEISCTSASDWRFRGKHGFYETKPPVSLSDFLAPCNKGNQINKMMHSTPARSEPIHSLGPLWATLLFDMDAIDILAECLQPMEKRTCLLPPLLTKLQIRIFSKDISVTPQFLVFGKIRGPLY